jgi:hypothetical protein
MPSSWKSKSDVPVVERVAKRVDEKEFAMLLAEIASIFYIHACQSDSELKGRNPSEISSTEPERSQSHNAPAATEPFHLEVSGL